MRPIKTGPEGSPAEILFREIRRWDAGAAANEVVVFRVFFFHSLHDSFRGATKKGLCSSQEQ